MSLPTQHKYSQNMVAFLRDEFQDFANSNKQWAQYREDEKTGIERYLKALPIDKLFTTLISFIDKLCSSIRKALQN